MTVKVTATCAWCLVTEITSLENPVPEGWHSREVSSPELDKPSVEENFCSDDHADHYLFYAPLAIAEAERDYTAKFFSKMNELRKSEGDSPREIVVDGSA